MSLLKLPKTQNPLRVVVIGATGYVGSRLVPELVQRGHHVTVYVRNPQRVPASWQDNVQVIVGEIEDAKQLKTALLGQDTMYWLVHSLGSRSKNWANKDNNLATQANQIARECKIHRVIYLSGLGEEEGSSDHLNSRHQTGEALADHLNVVELRAAIIIGSGSLSWALLRDLSQKLRIMITPKWVRNQTEPIAIRDVLHHLIWSMEQSDLKAGVYEIGSGEIFTYGELLDMAAQVQDKAHPIMIPFPGLTPKLSSWWLHFMTSADQRTARPIVEGLREDTIVKTNRLPHDIRHLPITEAMSRALGLEKRNEIVSYWFERSARKTEDTGGVKIEMDMSRTSETVSTQDAWHNIVTHFGNNYGHTQWLWKIRGAIDRMIGGPGMRIIRPRRELRTGDMFDFWRVEDIEKEQYLQLLAEMRSPGYARLRFVVSHGPEGKGSIVTVRASLEGARLAGKVYWYILTPFHRIIFSQMLKGILPDGH